MKEEMMKNVINRPHMAKLPEDAPDAVTLGCGSDRYPGTIIAEDDKAGIITVQMDDDRVVGGSMQNGSAEYEYYRNENGMVRYFRMNRNGRYEEVTKNDRTGRWNKAGYSGGVYLGHRRRYYDPHF